MSRIRDDPRIDPRIRQAFGAFPSPVNPGDAASREQLVEEANSEEAAAMRQRWDAFLERCDTEELAPSTGLAFATRKLASEPDGNIINMRFIRPGGNEPIPCVYYIHGGGMQSGSFLQGNYRAWGRIIAARGVAVAMVDFRNALTPSSVPEIGPFPAGLNDCVSGLKWVAANAAELGIDCCRRGQRRRESDPRHGSQAVARWRHRVGPRSLRTVPVHRRQMAARQAPVVDREQRHPAGIAQQPRRDGLRHRGVGRRQPAGLARIRVRRGRDGPAGDRYQRERVRSATRRGYRILSAAARRGRPGAVSSSDGDDSRHGDISDCRARGEPGDGAQHRRLLPPHHALGIALATRRILEYRTAGMPPATPRHTVKRPSERSRSEPSCSGLAAVTVVSTLYV